MTTRFNAKAEKRHGLSPLPTGYGSEKGLPDFSIPSCGIEDVDKAFFDLFDKEIKIQIIGSDSLPAIVPVVFAAGEKWSILKKGRPLRDRNNTLILPLITIMRTDISQSNEDITGRGINQQSGEIVIRRRLDKSDRSYQSLINKMLLTNQSNVADQTSGQVSTTRKVGLDVSDARVIQGALLYPNVNNNVIETIVVPSPQFYTVKYQISVWTQYMQHTNQIIEKIVTSYLPQAQSWKVTTKKGYWFIAKVDEGGFTSETSFEDMSQTERFIKTNFEVTIPAYFFATHAPGAPVPLKRYVSSPIISFETQSSNDFLNEYSETEVNKFEINDIDPITGKKLLVRDSKSYVNGYVNGSDDVTLPEQEKSLISRNNDPYVSNNLNRVLADESRKNISTAKVITKNIKGETVITGVDFGNLQNIVSNK